ncbi:hypothetical protein T4D_16012 [Trichinella pseudospiralis]|uniref:Uncharacterized protein n=1 Tax=Trichinella pseudospiralis TaxID=6337 RepID=A0A0V1FGH9_TRIPS|nr:hypothetical protein T4D_16012 [Trichinella pseudospiralis]
MRFKCEDEKGNVNVEAHGNNKLRLTDEKMPIQGSCAFIIIKGNRITARLICLRYALILSSVSLRLALLVIIIYEED